MTGRRGLIAGVAAILLAGPGCVCCGNKGYGLAREAAPGCDVPDCQRNQVYVFAVSGVNPAGMIALDGFRKQLNRQGFAKVATGQVIHAWWMAHEMRRIRADDPNAVFVLVGSEAGGPTAVRLAEQAVGRGIPVGGVVLIDAEGKTPAPRNGVRTLTVGGGYGTASASGVESLAVPDAGRFTLPSDSRAVAAVTHLLNEVAAATALPPTEEVVGWEYEHAPEPRPILDPSRSPEWVFLFDQPGGVTRPIGESAPVVVAKPSQPATTAARR